MRIRTIGIWAPGAISVRLQLVPPEETIPKRSVNCRAAPISVMPPDPNWGSVGTNAALFSGETLVDQMREMYVPGSCSTYWRQSRASSLVHSTVPQWTRLGHSNHLDVSVTLEVTWLSSPTVVSPSALWAVTTRRRGSRGDVGGNDMTNSN